MSVVCTLTCLYNSHLVGYQHKLNLQRRITPKPRRLRAEFSVQWLEQRTLFSCVQAVGGQWSFNRYDRVSWSVFVLDFLDSDLGLEPGFPGLFFFVDVLQFLQADDWVVHEVGHDISLDLSSSLFTETWHSTLHPELLISSLNRPQMMGMVESINSACYGDEGRAPVNRLTTLPCSLGGGEWLADRLLGIEQSWGFESLITGIWVISMTVVWYPKVYAGNVEETGDMLSWLWYYCIQFCCYIVNL